ncbi:putative small heat shock protein [Staphylococcus saccharolyticus]|uniref:Putative small heat shock protein n=1 Tax=Staphylococcus saccharolyticus TaxID=33028 RepID=A0A380H0X5_9STAP|nr:putative small heat shock protein [Staphylococcus saccharolyticus]
MKFEHSTLTIKAYKNINVDNKNLQLDERTNGELLRRFEFEDINKDAIEASYEDGVLSVTLPKKVYEGDDTTTISIH